MTTAALEALERILNRGGADDVLRQVVGEFLQRVATLISSHCLVGWDTGGEAWEPERSPIR